MTLAVEDANTQPKTEFASYVDVGAEDSDDNSLVLAISQVGNDMDC